MKRIALTGSIGTGKSTTLDMLAALGIPILSADAVVHQLLAKGGGAVAEVGALFPEALEDGAINRAKLGEMVFADAVKLKALEAILHPLVMGEEARWLEAQAAHGEALAVVEIPLLFETNAQARFDVVLTTTTPDWLKWSRVKPRQGMTRERFQAILKRQTPDAEKRKRAHFVIHTWLGKGFAAWQVGRIIARVKGNKNA